MPSHPSDLARFLETYVPPVTAAMQRRRGECSTVSAADGANLLLGLVAVVAVVSTLGGMACVFWVTRAPSLSSTTRPP